MWLQQRKETKSDGEMTRKIREMRMKKQKGTWGRRRARARRRKGETESHAEKTGWAMRGYLERRTWNRDGDKGETWGYHWESRRKRGWGNWRMGGHEEQDSEQYGDG